VTAAQSDYVSRDISTTSDVASSGGTRTFAIGTGASASNTHVVYFHHPDWVQCEIIDPATGVRALDAYGIEMRMMANDGTTLVGGGSSSEGFGEIYLGDKNDYNGGADGRYTIDVESNGLNTASTRPYRLKCESGSGSTLGELIRYQEVINRF
jgi:hypothetical protein